MSETPAEAPPETPADTGEPAAEPPAHADQQAQAEKEDFSRKDAERAYRDWQDADAKDQAERAAQQRQYEDRVDRAKRHIESDERVAGGKSENAERAEKAHPKSKHQPGGARRADGGSKPPPRSPRRGDPELDEPELPEPEAPRAGDYWPDDTPDRPDTWGRSTPEQRTDWLRNNGYDGDVDPDGNPVPPTQGPDPLRRDDPVNTGSSAPPKGGRRDRPAALPESKHGQGGGGGGGGKGKGGLPKKVIGQRPCGKSPGQWLLITG